MKQAGPQVPLDLSVVVPTFNERANVAPFLESLNQALEGIPYEIIFVDDDSEDGTAACIREVAVRNPYVRVLQRLHRRGLASACIEGMMAAAAPYIAVMDADLQHDEHALPEMLRQIKARDLDLTIATRNSPGGSMGNFARHRVFLSNLGQSLSRWVCRMDITDPMSGFFVVRREYLEEVVRSASGVGFKILLDLIASSRRPVRVGEVSYTFRERLHGVSKLDFLVGLEYLQLLLDKKIGTVVPVRFCLFGLVGASGVIVALLVLYLAISVAHLEFRTGQAVATLVAMTGNFFLNNSVTYRDRRLKGRGLWTGLVKFYLACLVGAGINLHMAEAVKEAGASWFFAGAIGLIIGAVWNYGITSFSTWKQARTVIQHAQWPRVE
jgi:dolichol-phosphate mannosyltransferase